MSADERVSKAVALIELAKESCEFYLDQHGTLFAWTKNPGKVMMLRSREFKSFLTHQFYELCGEAVSGEAANVALNVLEAEAANRPRVELSTRIHFDEQSRSIVVDACGTEQTVVQIKAEGWTLTALDRPLFRRYSHMQSLPKLEKGVGSSEDLKELIRRFRLKEPRDEVLIAGFIGTAYVANIPHAILLVHGSQGSTKTTFTATIRKLVDPSSLATLSPSERREEFVQQLAHNYCAPFDNVNRLKSWQIDNLCRAATGEGFVKRQLYTDEDDVVFSYRRVIILNGINYPAYRGDFLDRGLPIEFARVPRADRKQDREIQAWLNWKVPRAMAGVFEGLSNALGIIDAVRTELKELPRMADFAVWGEAFCRAVGYEPMEFFGRYMEKIAETNSEVLENDVVAELILKLMREPPYQTNYLTKDHNDGSLYYAGTASDLLKVLEAINEDTGLADPKQLPRSPRLLSGGSTIW